MYSTKTVRTYSTTKQSLDSLPLARLFADISGVQDRLTEEIEAKRESLLEKEKLNFLTRWNETNESSYEGDFDFLADSVQAKLDALVDLDDLGSKEEAKILEEFGKTWSIPKNADWFFSQMLAKIAQIPLKKNERGYSARQLFLDGFTGRPEMMALLFIAKSNARGAFLEKQTSAAYRDYSALVPLVMSAFKKMHDIGYEDWDRTEIYGITSSNLTEAMLLPSLPEMTTEDVLEDRRVALTVKSGVNQGNIRDPITTYGLFPLAESPLHKIPKLAQIMMCQTWCAHPTNRSKYMILNPLAWDNMPEPLVTSEFSAPTQKKATKSGTTLQGFSWTR